MFIFQQVINGLAIGAVYGLVALGFVLIYKATEVVNFAQGELMMLGAFFVYTCINFWHIPYWAAFLMTIVFMGLLCMALERVVLRPLVGQPAFALLMVTLGFGTFARSVASMVPGWGTDTYTFPTPFTDKTVNAAGLVMSWEHLSVIIITLALVLLLYVFFKFTRVGIAMQATSQNQLAAFYMGISVKGVFTMSWAISGAVSAIAGILLSPITFVHMNMGYIGLKAFPAAVLGGFGSIPGAIIGGFIIGISEILAGVYLPKGFKDVFAYIILILVLLLWPQGLFGIQQKKKV